MFAVPDGSLRHADLVHTPNLGCGRAREVAPDRSPADSFLGPGDPRPLMISISPSHIAAAGRPPSVPEEGLRVDVILSAARGRSPRKPLPTLSRLSSKTISRRAVPISSASRSSCSMNAARPRNWSITTPCRGEMGACHCQGQVAGEQAGVNRPSLRSAEVAPSRSAVQPRRMSCRTPRPGVCRPGRVSWSGTCGPSSHVAVRVVER